MPQPPTYTFTLTVRVLDNDALAAAAAKSAQALTMSDTDWENARKAYGDPIGADLMMLLDTGRLPGCHTVNSQAIRSKPDHDPRNGTQET